MFHRVGTSIDLATKPSSEHLVSQAVDTDKYTCERVIWIQAITPKLFRFRTTRPAGFRFVAGQWARLGVTDAKRGDSSVWRAYSIASAEYDEYLEFYSIVVPSGAFTQTLAQLELGDVVMVERMAYGFLTTSRFQTDSSDNVLWLLSTGTGLAPFISVLQSLQVWQDYKRIILVHGVRHANELAYANQIFALRTHELFAEYMQQNPQQLHYQACISREWPCPQVPNALQGRITTLLENGELERSVGASLNPLTSRVMICGNPQMVSDTRAALKARGLQVSRTQQAGQIAVENYW